MAWRAYKSLEWFIFTGFALAGFFALIAVVTLIATARLVRWQVSPTTPSDVLHITDADRICSTDSDCSTIATVCGNCNCREAVNKIYAQKYGAQYSMLCTNVPPILCEPCANSAHCINSRCVLSATSIGSTLPIVTLPQNPNGNFTLYVSNQSSAINPVDIVIWIDGQSAVAREFDVGNQHNWHTFQFSLPASAHQLMVKSTKGTAELQKPFAIRDRHWAVVDYWYYPETHYEPTPNHFSFDIRNEPIYFE